MKKTLALLSLTLGLFITQPTVAQDAKPATEKQMRAADKSGMNDRMAAARAAKAAKKADADKMKADATTKADKMDAKANKMANKADMKADKMADKASMKADKMAGGSGMKDDKMSKSATMSKPKADKTTMAAKPVMKEEKASPADYKAPVDRSSKGPNGEVVRTGPRGGKYYINKNGNKTYLSSVK